MIHPVILAGGTGSRLWPLSRKSFPKQFSNLLGERSLFQDTVSRAKQAGLGEPIILTGQDYRFLVSDQLDEIDAPAREILIEPEGRNTAPAILMAALTLETTPDALMFVMPSDHAIADQAAFSEALSIAATSALKGKLVTFGEVPTRPETGFGYLKLAEHAPANVSQAQDLVGFVEKPGLKRAEEFVKSGRYLWNAGMFMFRVGTIIEAFETLAPTLIMPCRAALAAAKQDLGATRIGAEAYLRAPDISIDYAIMEKSTNLVAVPMAADWCDLGSWRAVHTVGEEDQYNNVLEGAVSVVDCTNSLLKSSSENVQLVGVGLDNIAAISVGDAVLVADMNRPEDIKKAVADLKEQGVKQAEEFPRCHRPWGYFESLSLGKRFQVKRIMVHPGAALSLQSHMHRSEHWIVVEGSARVTVDDMVKLVTENESVYIPLGATHRLENPGKVPLNLIEVQSGPYLGEDDIIRYEDVYARVTAA